MTQNVTSTEWSVRVTVTGTSRAVTRRACAGAAIIAAAVPATQALSHAGGTRPAGRADRLRVGLSAVTLCQIGQCLSVCPGEPEPPPSHYCLPLRPLRSNNLGFPRPAGPRPETRPAGYKPKGVIQRLSGGCESAALASPVKFSVRPSNSVIETPSR